MRLYATDLETREVSGGPAICARPSEKAPSPTRWNTASGSVGGICLRTTLSKDSVWVSHLCALAGGPSALARGKRGDQPEHDRSSCPHNFLSHELQTRIRNERYRKGQFFGIIFAAFCRFGLVFLDRVGVKNPGTGRIGPRGESLAAPRGVSDASRRCKQRPSKYFRRRTVFQQSRLLDFETLRRRCRFHRPCEVVSRYTGWKPMLLSSALIGRVLSHKVNSIKANFSWTSLEQRCFARFAFERLPGSCIVGQAGSAKWHSNLISENR